MEHIKTTIELNGSKAKKKTFKDFKVLDFTPMSGYWIGACKIIPTVIDSLPNLIYKSNQCLTWYERQQEKHNLKMIEFKKIFPWLKK